MSRGEKRKAESLSPESDQEYEYYEGAYATNIPGELGGASPEEQLRNVCGAWGDLVQNTNLL